MIVTFSFDTDSADQRAELAIFRDADKFHDILVSLDTELRAAHKYPTGGSLVDRADNAQAWRDRLSQLCVNLGVSLYE